MNVGRPKPRWDLCENLGAIDLTETINQAPLSLIVSAQRTAQVLSLKDHMGRPLNDTLWEALVYRLGYRRIVVCQDSEPFVRRNWAQAVIQLDERLRISDIVVTGAPITKEQPACADPPPVLRNPVRSEYSAAVFWCASATRDIETEAVKRRLEKIVERKEKRIKRFAKVVRDGKVVAVPHPSVLFGKHYGVFKARIVHRFAPQAPESFIGSNNLLALLSVLYYDYRYTKVRLFACGNKRTTESVLFADRWQQATVLTEGFRIIGVTHRKETTV